VSVGDQHRHFAATVGGSDQDTDLAVLKIPATDLPALAFANSDIVKQGQIVVALGSPLGLDNLLPVGFVSATIDTFALTISCSTSRPMPPSIPVAVAVRCSI
jgi:S1-C subfamily serine protease